MFVFEYLWNFWTRFFLLCSIIKKYFRCCDDNLYNFFYKLSHNELLLTHKFTLINTLYVYSIVYSNNNNKKRIFQIILMRILVITVILLLLIYCAWNDENVKLHWRQFLLFGSVFFTRVDFQFESSEFRNIFSSPQ